jgi:hypothetical protein
MSSRRAFLKSSAGLAAALAAGPLHNSQVPGTTSLPTVRFGNYEISRLLVGCNQFYGFSHFDGVLDQAMREWNTPERVCQTLLSCEQNGINAYQYAHVESMRTPEDLERYRAAGGKMQLVAVHLGKSPLEEVVSRIKPMALYHHGEAVDILFRDEKWTR